MAVIAKVGLLEHGGKVRTKAGIYEARRAPDGWYVVQGPTAEGSGKVRYDEGRGTLEVQRPGVDVSIRFRAELEHTTFEFGGHTYEVGTMDFGDISIREGARPVVRGHETVSGVRLLSVAPELEPIERELAFGLALRGASVDENYWREDEPFLEGIKERAEDAFLREDAKARHE